MKNLDHKDSEVIRLIKRDVSHKSYFFKRVSEKRWYFKLKGESFFDIEKIPGPVISEDGGAYFPGWLPFIYFEKLVKNLNSEEDEVILNDLVAILESVANKKINNPHVWADFIRVISNLPNKFISYDLLKNIPNWLDTEYNTSLPSHEINESLLPKFLFENASNEDFNKAEVILTHILKLKEENYHSSYSGYTEKKYKPLIDLYWLRHTLLEKELLELIGEKLSSGVIYKLADNLREMLYGQVVEKNLSSKFFLRFDIEDRNLKASYDPDPATELADATTVVIHDFQKLEEQELANQITKKVKGESPDIKIELDAIEYFTRRLFTDHSIIWCNSLHKLKNGEIMRDETKVMHVHLLMELARIKAETDEKIFTELKEKFLENEYPQPIFKRVLFYVLSKTWSKNKEVFWEIVKNEDEAGYFSDSLLSKELFFLLRENVENFNKGEKEKLERIIKKGPKKEEGSDNDIKYWQLQWYSALKDDPELSEKYEKLSEDIDIDSEHYETLGEVKTRIGSVSPFTPEEIIDMGIPQLLEEIKTFKPGRGIDDPTYGGFGDAIQRAVAQNPNEFTEDLLLLKEAPFFCFYNVLFGFDEAWRNQINFEWNNLLDLILEYLEFGAFKDNELVLEEDRREIDKDSVIRQIGRLISEGTKKDENAFDKRYLPIAETILKIIVPNLKVVDDIEKSNMDFPTYSLNSKAGKVLMALINYSLRYARVHYGKKYEGKCWKDDIKKLYEEALNKEIIDAYILIGFYFRQFNYLDKKWLIEKVKDFEDLSDKKWKAFMGGYLFDYPARNQETYQIMYPHYKKAIDRDMKFVDFGYSKTVDHIAAFYLWKIESLKEEGLINELISKGTAEDLSRLANFFREVNDQIEEKEREELRPKILELWKRIHEKVESSEPEGKEKVLSNLSKFMKYFEKLDGDIAPLIKASAPYVNHDFNIPSFLEELNHLKDYEKSQETALYIGEILLSMLQHFTPDYKKSDIKELVSYMYEFKDEQKIQEMADSICAEYVRRGKDFLRKLYKENR